jgi:NAD+ diphosphatase
MTEPNALTGALIDRAADRRRRDPAWLEAQHGDPAARALVLGDAGVRIAAGRLDLVPLAGLPATEDPADRILLGVDDVGPVFAVDEDPPVAGRRAPLVGAGGMRGEAPVQRPDRLGMREAAGALTQEEGGLVAYAAALLNWHRAARFCGVCGGRTVPGEAGATRVCAVCGTHHHPRTDPVVIMLVTDGDRVLLGRQSAWPAGRYSALAGFVSPGESLEEAVAREVREEVGVMVGRPVYRSSQPWPFPASLMLGFHVPYVSGAIDGTDDELEDARWFTRDEVREAVREDSWDDAPTGGGLLLPPRSAIARRLVEEWVAG